MVPKKMHVIVAAALLFSFQSQAQLTIQSGATFYMQPGSTVTVQGNVDNAGTLNNDGSVRVQGNYTNTGSYTGTGTAGILEVYGSGNSNLAAGASPIANLVINKTTASDVVALTSSAIVNNSFTLTNGIVTTNPATTPTVVLSAPATATFSYAAGKEVIGSVKRTAWTAGTARVFNATNMLVTTNAGTTPSDFTVTMIPAGDPSLAEREVKRKFGFAQTGGSGFTADIRYPYAATELNTNTEANLVPWYFQGGTEWNARLTPVSRDVANKYVSTTGIPATDLPQEWKLADPNYTMNITAYLRGPWNGSTMLTTLNAAGLLQLTQPYNDSYFDSYNGGESVAPGFFAANPTIVDWVLVEFRKPSDNDATHATFSTVAGRKVGFLKSNGSVVKIDGTTPMSFDISKQGGGFIVVKHRNHLSIMSNLSPSNSSGSYTNDFSTLAGIYDNAALSSDPAQLLPSSTKYGLWAGNSNKDFILNNGDVGLVRSNANASLAGYVFGDVNLDGIVNNGDVGLTRANANTAAQTHTFKSATGRINKEPTTHIPTN